MPFLIIILKRKWLFSTLTLTALYTFSIVLLNFYKEFNYMKLLAIPLDAIFLWISLIIDTAVLFTLEIFVSIIPFLHLDFFEIIYVMKTIKNLVNRCLPFMMPGYFKLIFYSCIFIILFIRIYFINNLSLYFLYIWISCQINLDFLSYCF